MHTSVRSKRSVFVLAWFMFALPVAPGTSIVRADDEEKADYNQLQRELKEAYRATNYKKALKKAEKMHELRRGSVEVMYNIACLNCLLGEKDKAYIWLEKTVDAGYRDADYLLNDYDFRTIRGEDRFRQLIRRMRTRTGVGDRKTRGSSEKGHHHNDEDAHEHGHGHGHRHNHDHGEKIDRSDDTDEIEESIKADEQELEPTERIAKVRELTRKLIEVSDKGDKDKALKLALVARAHAEILYDEFKDHERHGRGITAEYSLTNYNAACMYSLKNKKDKAFKYLNKAIELGGFGENIAASIEGDSDFENIRQDPRYAKAVKKAKKIHRERRREGRERARSNEPPPKKEVDFQWKVTLPDDHKKSRKAPLIVALHHYHGSMDKTADRWKDAANELGAILLTPQGTFEVRKGKYEWGKAIDSIEENVMGAINEVMDKYKIDEDKIVLTGFSQGGWAAWALAQRNPDAFCGIIPVAGNFKVESESDFEDEDLAKLRIFVMVGADESSKTLNSNKKAVKRFKKIGAKVSMNIYEDVGHSFPENETEEQIKALRFVLKG